MKRLSEALRKNANPASDSGRQLLAGGRLVQEIEMLREGQLIGRDIRIAKVANPQKPGERPNAVYAVRTAAGPGDRLVIEIPLRHE